MALAALGWPDLPLLAASLEWAAIAGPDPVLFVTVALSDAAFFAACASLLAGAFFGSFELKIPVILSMIDMAKPLLESNINAAHC
ncbi:hypothetical protein [Mesorhizobium sp. 128a]